MPRTPSSSAGNDLDEPASLAVGRTIEDHVAAGMDDPEERAEFERLAAFEQLARLVILRRQALGISQAELARRMNAPQSVVSRIDSGQHQTNTSTLKRIAEALDGRAVMGFAFGPTEAEDPMIVRL